MSEPSSSPGKRRTARRREDRRLLAARRELDAAWRVSEILSQVRQPDELIARALEIVVEVMDAEGGSILLADPVRRELVFRHSIGIRPATVGAAIPWDRGIAGAVFQGGEATIVNDVQSDTRHFKGIDAATSLVTVEMITAPLKQWQATTLGVIEVINKRGGRFNEQDLSLAKIVSTIAAAAIERAQLDEEAKLAVAARLVGGISHDIKNLLTPIVCGADLLGEFVGRIVELLPPERRGEAQEELQRCRTVLAAVELSSRRIQDRMKEITDCIQGLGQPPRFAPCALSAVVAQVFETLGVLAAQQGVALVAAGLERLPLIAADETKLFNLFYNLVNNALAEMPSGGSVSIGGAAAPEAGGVRVEVTDTGRGMPPEVRDRLFTDGGVTSHKRLGSGLGTKLVKDVIDAHGGQIAVQSTLGAGTTFRMFLPLAQGPRFHQGKGPAQDHESADCSSLPVPSRNRRAVEVNGTEES
jgi:signal transduction histidine kinase